LMKFNDNMSKLDHSGNLYIGRTGWWKGLIILNPIFLKYWIIKFASSIIWSWFYGMNPVPLC
jgi:hypothetical protein